MVMLIITTDKPAFKERKAMAFKQVLNSSLEAQEVFIRRQYDCAGTDALALAAIEVAEMLGFPDLAEQMKSDFDKQTGGNES